MASRRVSMLEVIDILVKGVGTTVFVFAAFTVPALLVVGTGYLFTTWLGDTWYAGLLLAPITLIEFFGVMLFFMWAGPHVGDWFISDIARSDTQDE